MSTVSVRYIVTDIDAAIGFYTTHLQFEAQMHPNDLFAMLVRGDLRLVLVKPTGQRRAGRGRAPMPTAGDRNLAAGTASASRSPTWPPPSGSCVAAAPGSATTS